jgi:hypothetical protein
MTRRYEDEDDDDRVVPDGGSVHVPLHFMDSTQRAVASGKAVTVVDGLGQPAGQRPGYCFSNDGTTDQSRGAAEASYLKHKDWLENAHRRKPKPFKPATSVAELEELRRQSESARQRSIERMENAWRRKTA